MIKKKSLYNKLIHDVLHYGTIIHVDDSERKQENGETYYYRTLVILYDGMEYDIFKTNGEIVKIVIVEYSGYTVI